MATIGALVQTKVCLTMLKNPSKKFQDLDPDADVF